MAINDKLTSEVYKNNKIMTTNTKRTNQKKKNKKMKKNAKQRFQ